MVSVDIKHDVHLPYILISRKNSYWPPGVVVWVEVDDIQEEHGVPQGGATTQQSHQVAQTLIEQEEKDGSEDPDFKCGARGIKVDVFVGHHTGVFITTCTVSYKKSEQMQVFV